MKLRERIVKARTDRNLSQKALGAAVGLTRGAVATWERKDKSVRPRQRTLERIAVVTGVPQLWLESGVGGTGDWLMVVGAVAAGVWKEGSVSFTAYPISDYPIESQRLYEVHGTSVNRIAKDGQFLHAVNVEISGITPEDDDLVVVRRTERGIMEYTARLLSRNGKGWVLKPLSDDAEWPSDIPYIGDESTETVITDVVVGVVAPVWRRRRHASQLFDSGIKRAPRPRAHPQPVPRATAQ